MRALFCRWLDRWVIQSAAKRLLRRTDSHPTSGAGHATSTADIELGKIPSMPPNLQFTSRSSFRFRSAVESPWPRNNAAQGRFFAAPGNAKRAVILVHGWNADFQYRLHFPLLASMLNRRGVSAAALELPFHGQRRPTGPDARRDFISTDIEGMTQATRQSLADLRSVYLWLKQLGYTEVGFWGFSMGAWMTGYLATQEPAPDFAVLLTPICRMDRAIDELAFCKPIRSSLAAGVACLQPLNLARQRLILPPNRVLIIEAVYDQFAPAESVEELWKAWGHPTLCQASHGHISILISWPILRAAVDWCAGVGLPGPAQVRPKGTEPTD